MARSTSASGEELPPVLVLFDGVCGLCNAWVDWILNHDPAGTFHFAMLQGSTAAGVRARHPDLPADLDSILLVEQDAGGERVYYRSDAVFRIFRRVGRPWSLVSWWGVFPRFLTDIGYRLVARTRYALFGKKDSCRMIRPEEHSRFLDLDEDG
jgi:predicted DCC family thiol-disulfide oxidoreductase YuxK